MFKELNYTDSYIEGLLKEGNDVIATQEERLRHKLTLDNRIIKLEGEITEQEKELDTYLRALTLIGRVSDDNTKRVLDKITTVLNKALKVLFPYDVIDVALEKEMYRNTYPHFVVSLTMDGKKRTFKQNGTGLAQIVSFLFTVSLIDARNGRKIVVMDELLNGLHPDAKYIIKGLIEALSNRFQFIVVEYDLDIGKQYEVIKREGTATVEEYESNTYYEDLAKMKANKRATINEKEDSSTKGV